MTEGVVRIEGTVRRPMGAHSEFVHRLLKMLESEGFNYSPRFQGLDDRGREVLSYIDGECGTWRLTWLDSQILAVTRILREFHDCTSSTDLAQDHECVCHGDFAPWNLIFRDDMPIGMIDFDGAAPGKRIEDLSYMAWTFLGLGVVDSISKQVHRLDMIYKEYGMEPTGELATIILEKLNKNLTKRRVLAENSPDGDERKSSEERASVIQREIRWIKEHLSDLEHY